MRTITKKAAALIAFAAATLALHPPLAARADGTTSPGNGPMTYADAQTRPTFGRGGGGFNSSSPTTPGAAEKANGAAFNNGKLDPSYDWHSIKIQHAYVGLFALIFKGTTEIPVDDYYAQAQYTGSSVGIGGFGGSSTTSGFGGIGSNSGFGNTNSTGFGGGYGNNVGRGSGILY